MHLLVRGTAGLVSCARRARWASGNDFTDGNDALKKNIYAAFNGEDEEKKGNLSPSQTHLSNEADIHIGVHT